MYARVYCIMYAIYDKVEFGIKIKALAQCVQLTFVRCGCHV